MTTENRTIGPQNNTFFLSSGVIIPMTALAETYTPAQKVELVAMVEEFACTFPYQLDARNQIQPRYGRDFGVIATVFQDPQAAASNDPSVVAQAGPDAQFGPVTATQPAVTENGGMPTPFIDWDYMPASTIHKLLLVAKQMTDNINAAP